MPRPNLEKQRVNQILNAFETCILRYGVEAVSLDDIARLAGLSRPLVRHHGGNKAQLIEALFGRFLQRTLKALNALQQELPDQHRVQAIIDLLFDTAGPYRREGRLAGQFLSMGRQDPSIGDAMVQWMAGFFGFLENNLHEQFPTASNADAKLVAKTVAALYLGDDFTDLWDRDAAREWEPGEAAKRLLLSLSR